MRTTSQTSCHFCSNAHHRNQVQWKWEFNGEYYPIDGVDEVSFYIWCLLFDFRINCHFTFSWMVILLEYRLGFVLRMWIIHLFLSSKKRVPSLLLLWWSPWVNHLVWFLLCFLHSSQLFLSVCLSFVPITLVLHALVPIFMYGNKLHSHPNKKEK